MLPKNISNELAKNLNFEGKDFSTNDFINLNIDDNKERFFDNTYFKGCIFENVSISNAKFRHVEFDETTFTDKCYFYGCYFNSSDFVYNIFEDVIFENCYFDNGEWRESSLKNVQFRNCSFKSTTISLCKFDNCDFDEDSSLSFQGQSKTYNVFFKTIFPKCNIEFIEYNFGLVSEQKLLYKNNINSNLFYELSIMYFTKTLLNRVFIEKILIQLNKFSNSKARNFQAKLKYITNMIMMMSQKHLSFVQTEYLYNGLLSEISESKNQLCFLELIKLLTSIGEDIKSRESIIHKRYDKYIDIKKKGYTLEFNFNNTYSKEDMELFINSLSIYLNLNTNDIKLLNYSKGSTKIVVLISKVVLLTTLLSSINAFLPEVKEVIKNTHDIYKEFKNFEKTIVKENKNNYIMNSIQKVDTSKSKRAIDISDTKVLDIEGKVSLTII